MVVRKQEFSSPLRIKNVEIFALLLEAALITGDEKKEKKKWGGGLFVIQCLWDL